jgi:hypothetical protein
VQVSTVDPKFFAGALSYTARHVSDALGTLGWLNCLFLVFCASVAWAICRLDVTATAHSAISAAAAAHQTEATNRWSRQLFCDFVSAWIFGPAAPMSYDSRSWGAQMSWQSELMPLWHALGNR